MESRHRGHWLEVKDTTASVLGFREAVVRSIPK